MMEHRPMDPKSRDRARPLVWSCVRLLAGVLALSLLAGCAVQEKKQAEDRYARAKALFAERCKTAGEFIHRTVEDVEGVYIMRWRPEMDAGESQYEEDPYGRDFIGEALASSLLRDFEAHAYPKGGALLRGFLFVEGRSPDDRRLYRYTGSIRDEVHPVDKAIARRFRRERQPIDRITARYGVTFEDISTIEDRAYWIAGSSLRVVDLQTGEVLGERIGYLMDHGQGANSGGRAPWLIAIRSNPCPAYQPTSRGKLGQTSRFVEKVLKPR